MSDEKSVVRAAAIEHRILLIRGEKVIVDADLAGFYGVTTKRLNEQVKRNRGRFPEDFVFRLTALEKAQVVANCDHLHKLKFSTTLPNVFTEHGAIMVASVLSTERAVATSVFVVRAFVRLRRCILQHHELARRMDELERQTGGHSRKISSIVEAIRRLMGPEEIPARRRIGFRMD